jgi:hypothetical protein
LIKAHVEVIYVEVLKALRVGGLGDHQHIQGYSSRRAQLYGVNGMG